MIVECASVVIDADYRSAIMTYAVGDLVHRAFSEELSEPHEMEMRLIPCISWWVRSDRCRVVDTHPTCVACIATRWL